MNFNSVAAYIEAVRKDPSLAMIPMGLVAELKGISRSAVAEQIRTGALEGIVVTGGRKTWRGVRPSGLFEQAERAERHLRDRRAKVLGALTEAAAAGRTATYSEIMEPAGMSARNPRHRAEIGVLLGELSVESQAASGFLIAALAVQKATGCPNALFFQLARDMGVFRTGGDEQAFWHDQCDRAFAHYAREMAEA